MKRYISVNIILTYEVFRVNNLCFRKRYRSENFATCINSVQNFVAKCRKPFPQILLFFPLFACYNTYIYYYFNHEDARDLRR